MIYSNKPGYYPETEKQLPKSKPKAKRKPRKKKAKPEVKLDYDKDSFLMDKEDDS